MARAWLVLMLLVSVAAPTVAADPTAGDTTPAITDSLSLEQFLEAPAWTETAQACCKTCRKGKACGDSCIARDKTCTKPPGCACDAERE
jgi:hypothetical protein